MKVLIADDHVLFRQGLTQFMSAGFKDLAITEAGSFYDVLALNSRLPEFDLILLDLAMPGMDGFAGVAMVREHAPDVPLVIVSASERREDVLRALDLGVTGYISKSMTGRELLDALASVLAGLVDFAIAFLVLVGMMIYYGTALTSQVVWILPLLLLALVTALGVGLWLSSLNVQYRDVRYVTPFLTQAWLFITPIAYPSSLLGEPWRTLYGLNPMVGVVEGFRWALLGSASAPGPIVAASALAALALLVSGAFYFRRMEKTFADIV